MKKITMVLVLFVLSIGVVHGANARYKVRSGDTWQSLSLKYNVSLETLVSMNQPTAGNTINVPTVVATTSPVATGTIKAMDTANTITDPQWFVKAYNAGYRLYIMHSVNWNDCNAWSRTQTQLKMALDAGLKIAVYTRNPNCWANGITAAGPYQSQLQFFAIDVETDPGVKVTQAMVDGVRSMGIRPVIYSSWGMWPLIMGNNSSFTGVPLWDTQAPTFAIFGGWTTRIGTQEIFEYNLNGIRIDTNTFDASFMK